MCVYDLPTWSSGSLCTLCQIHNWNINGVCFPICGDGYVIAPEICDDGTDDGIGCAQGCLGVNPLYTCTPGSVTGPSVCTPICGDGIIINPPEICDDHNTVNNDGCSSICQIETGWTCVS